MRFNAIAKCLTVKNTLIITLFATTISIFAQRNSGIKMGLNYSWTSTNKTSNPYYQNDYEMVPTLTYHFGYSWNFKMVNKWSIQTDIIYNWKGSTSEYKNPNDPKWALETMEYEVPGARYGGMDKIHYISVPITLNYMITPHFFAEMGGEFSFNPMGGSYDWFDFGITTGAGYCTKYADISLRYTHGLTSPSYPQNNTSSYYRKYRTFQISVTIPIFKHLKRN